eukprot:g19764.t1
MRWLCAPVRSPVLATSLLTSALSQRQRGGCVGTMRLVQIFTLILLLPFTTAQVCDIRLNTDHVGGNHVDGSACCALQTNTIPAADEAACCARCYASPHCTTWIFQPSNGSCWLTDATNDGLIQGIDRSSGKIVRRGCERPGGWCSQAGLQYDFFDCDGDYNPEHVCQDVLNPSQFGTIRNDTNNSCVDTWPTGRENECADAYSKCRWPLLGANQTFASCREFALKGEECTVTCKPGWTGSNGDPILALTWACAGGSNGMGMYEQGNDFGDFFSCTLVQCDAGFEPRVPAEYMGDCKKCVNGTFAGGDFGRLFCENITVCERPVGWCAGPGLQYDTMDCDGDGAIDHVCQNVSYPTTSFNSSFLQFGIIRSQNQCNDSFPNDIPPDAPQPDYVCQSGCRIIAEYVNDDWCDCLDCDDELAWNCSDCLGGCPANVPCNETTSPTAECGSSRYPPPLRSACDLLFWKCPRPALDEGYVFLDCPELALGGEPCTAGCAPGYVYGQPSKPIRRVMAGIEGDRNYTLRCRYDIELPLKNSFQYEYNGHFASRFSCIKVRCPAGFEPRTPVAYNDTDCVECPQGKFAGGTYPSASLFCQNLTVCERPVGWCEQSGLQYSSLDCDGDGSLDHICQSLTNPSQFGTILTYASFSCADTWPNANRSECYSGYGICSRPDQLLGPMMEYKNCRELALDGENCTVGCNQTGYPLSVVPPQYWYEYHPDSRTVSITCTSDGYPSSVLMYCVACSAALRANGDGVAACGDCLPGYYGPDGLTATNDIYAILPNSCYQCPTPQAGEYALQCGPGPYDTGEIRRCQYYANRAVGTTNGTCGDCVAGYAGPTGAQAGTFVSAIEACRPTGFGNWTWVTECPAMEYCNTTTDSCVLSPWVSPWAWETYGPKYGPYSQIVPPPPLVYNPKHNKLYIDIYREVARLTLPVGLSRVLYTFGTPAGHVLRCQSLVEVNGPCARNTFSATGSSPCAICPKGRYANNSGSTSCDPCMPGSTAYSACNKLGCLDHLAINYDASATLSLPSSCVYSATLTTQATAGKVLVRTGYSSLGQFNLSYKTARQPVLTQTTVSFGFLPAAPEQAVLHFGYGTTAVDVLTRRRLQGYTFLTPELLEPSAVFTISPDNLTLLEPLRVCAAVPALNVSYVSFLRLLSPANFSTTTGQNISNMREYLPTNRYTNNGTVCANIQLPGTYLLGNASSLPRDCQVSNWTNLTACSRTCGGGTYARLREIVQAPSSDGTQCPVLFQEVACNVALCPSDCVLSSYWSEWSTCSARCLAGSVTTSIQQRTRSVLIPASGGGSTCNQTIETRTCQVPSCDAATLRIIVAQLDNSGSRLTVSFSQPVAPAASELPLGTSFPCFRLLTPRTLSLLNASKCRWLGSVNTSSLQVTLGTAAQATLQDTLSFVPVLTSLGKAAVPLLDTTFMISPPSDLSSVAPIAQIMGTGVVPVCSAVVLDDYASRRSAGRAWVKEQWRMLTFSSSSSAVLGNGSVFRIPAKNLEAERSYIFELTVENWLGLSGSSNFLVKIIALPVPRVTLPTFLNMQVDNQLQLVPTLEWDSGCGRAEEFFHFEWSYESEDTALALESQSRVAISLVLPRRALVEGVAYIFTLTVTSIYDAQAQTSASTYVVATSPNPVTAVLAGGSLDLPVGLSDFYSLDARGSYDERDSEFASGLVAHRRRRALLTTAFPNQWYFSWSCYERPATPQTTTATTVTTKTVTTGTATFNTTLTITTVAVTTRTGFANLGSQTWPPNSATVCATEMDSLLSAADTTNSVLRVPSANLDLTKHYFFQVKVTRYNVSDSCQVEIRPRQATTFNKGTGIERVGIEVSQVSDVQWRDAWPSGQALSLSGVVTLWNATENSTRTLTSANFNLSEAALNDTSYQYIWRELQGKLDLRDRNIVSTPSNSLSLIILPEILEPLETYLFAFSVLPSSVDPATFLTDPESITDTLTATLAITVADAPLPGFCYVTPEVGEAFLTNFVLQCEHWSAQDATPLFYRFQQLLPILRGSHSNTQRTDTGERYLLSDWRDIPYTAPRRLFPLQADGWNRPVQRTSYNTTDGDVVNVTEVTIMASVRTFRGSLAELPFKVYLSDPVDPYAVLTSLLSEWAKYNFHRDINGLTENALILAQGLLPMLEDSQLAARNLPSRAQLLLLLFEEVDIMSSLLPADLAATLDRLAQMVTVITAMPSELVPSLRESVVNMALSFLNMAYADGSRETISSVSDWVFTILSQLQAAGFQNMTESESDRFLSFLRSLGSDLTKIYSSFQALDETVIRTSGNTTLTSAKQDSANGGSVTSNSGASLTIPKLDQGNVVMSILDQPDSLSQLATLTPSANLVISRSGNVFQMEILDGNGKKINLTSVKEPIRIVIPHENFDFGCTERSCDLWGSVQNAAQAGLSTVDYLWLTAGCDYSVDESTINTTICYCNPSSLQGGKLEVSKPADEEGKPQPGFTLATLTNYLCSNYRQFRPRINSVDVRAWAKLTPENLRENPVGLVLICSILAIYLLLLAWAVWNTNQQRRHLTRTQIRKTREIWVKNYMDTQRKKGCWNFMHQWWVVMMDKHLWLSTVVHKYGESFDQVARVNVLFMTVLVQMTVAALYYGIQSFLGSITVSVISVIVAGGLSELTRQTIKHAGSALPRDQFKYQVRQKRAEFLGLPPPKQPRRLHQRWRTVAYVLIFLVSITCLVLILVYSMQFDLTYRSEFVWTSQEGLKLRGSVVGETCDQLAECQKNCTAMEGECTGIQIREKDQRCSLINVQGDATPLSGYHANSLTFLYGNSQKWLKACLIAFFIDAFISRPLSAFVNALYVYFVVIKIPHLNIEGMNLKGFKSYGNMMQSEGALPSSVRRMEPHAAAEPEAFPPAASGVNGEDHSDHMSPIKKRQGSMDETGDDPETELSQLVEVDTCAHCGALQPAKKKGMDKEVGRPVHARNDSLVSGRTIDSSLGTDEEVGPPVRDHNASLVSGGTFRSSVEIAEGKFETGPAMSEPAQEGQYRPLPNQVSVEEGEANELLRQQVTLSETTRSLV